MATLKDLLLDKRLYFVKMGMSVFEVAKFMDSHNIGAVPVLDSENNIRGIFSERDLMRRCIVKELDLKQTLIEDVMTKEVIFEKANETPEHCMQIMKQSNIRHIPVVEGNNLIGMLSIKDLLLHDCKIKEEKIELLNTFIKYSG